MPIFKYRYWLLKLVRPAIDRAVLLVRAGKDEEARSTFNRIYWAVGIIQNDPGAPLPTFFFELDEYLNNENARHHGIVSKDLILGFYTTEYPEEVRALERYLSN